MFNALYELELQCDGTSSVNTEVCGVNVLDTFADLQEPVVIVTQCETGVQGTRNRVCGYRLSDINMEWTQYTISVDPAIQVLLYLGLLFHLNVYCSV